jgi:hypothetical protein
MTVPRSFAAFAIVFAVVYSVVYVICVEQNYALFSYHPAINQFGMGVQEPLDGPVMYWYGWMATAGIAASLAGLVACILPQAVARRLWSGWSWVVPAGVMVVFCYLLRNFFLQ